MMTKIYNLINLILLTFARLCFRKKTENKDKHFLIIRLDAIGDMIMFSPFVRELRRQEPEAKITLVINPLVKSLYENCPYVDKIFYFNGNKPIKPKIITSTFRAMIWGRKNLKGTYTDVFLPRCNNDTEGALMIAITSRCSNIVSFSEKQTKERASVNYGYDNFVNKKFITGKLQHEVETNLDFLRLAGYDKIKLDNLEIWFSKVADSNKKVDLLLCDTADDTNVLLGIGFSASIESKCWPLESFRKLFKRIQEHLPGVIFILIGGPGEEHKAKILSAEMPDIIDITGKFSLLETAALIKRCSIFIGNDSGPMHIAAAVGTPIIEILSCSKENNMHNSNTPIRFRPWKNECIILQPEKTLPPCTRECISDSPHCIRQITVQEVFEAVKALILKTELTNS